MSKVILYIHGMGGGGDSRIPGILRDLLSGVAEVVVRTYGFDPEEGAAQIALWMHELRPDLVVGESLGSIQALRIRSVPVLLVSPSLGAPAYLSRLAFLALIPGVTLLLDRIYRPRPGDRQSIHFTYGVMRRYGPHLEKALADAEGRDVHAFFGTRDHYRRSGIVSIRLWKRYFGETYTVYPGTHFMEEENIRKYLVPKIAGVLRLSPKMITFE